MIRIHQMPPAWGLPSLSVFSTKLATWLSLSGLPWEPAPGDLQKAPKGKVPYIELDGALLGDTHFIMRGLEKVHGEQLPAASHEDDALGHLVTRALEEGTYFNLLYWRWVDEPGFLATSQALSGAIPAEALGFVRQGVLEQLRQQGISRHSPAEVAELGQRDLQSLARTLGNRPYLLGDSPTRYDASVFALVAHALATPTDNPLTREAKRWSQLTGYVERVRQRCAFDKAPWAQASSDQAASQPRARG